MRVLVTGASGFLGRQVVKALRRRNHIVIAISRRNFDAGFDAGVTWHTADLLRGPELDEVLCREQPEGLVHCAWDTTPGKYWNTSKNLNWVAASLQLLESFVSNGGRRAVIAGTSAEYRWRGTETLNEYTSPLQPDSLYGTCKNSLRQIVESWASETDLSWAWGRVFCPFGVHEKPERLIPQLIQKLSTQPNLPFDSGSLIRDFLCVDDLGDAFAAVYESSVEGSINLASGEDTSIRDIVACLAEHTQNDEVKFGTLPDPTGQPERIVADTSRLRNDVGWSPRAKLRDRLAETVEWWQSQQPEWTAKMREQIRLEQKSPNRGRFVLRGRESA